MQNSPPSPPINKRTSLERTRPGLLMTKLSTRNLYDLQLKSADYEAMMVRFQLRKVSRSSADEGKFKHAVIDTVYGDKSKSLKSRRFSPRYLAGLLTKRKTWQHVWKVVTSPIAPGSWACTVHGLVMFGVNQFELFYLPFALSFYPDGTSGTVWIGLVLQLLHLIDLILNLNTAFMRQRELVTSRREIARDHMSKWFGLEVISALPTGAVYYISSVSAQVTKFLLSYDATLIALRLSYLFFVEQGMLPVRVIRDNKHLVSLFLYSRYAHLLGIAKLIWLVLLVTHYMGCVWHTITERPFLESVGVQYVASFYYAVQLIQGQGSVTGTWEENMFSTFVILTGSIILAIVFGNVAMLVANFNANTTSYHQKMESVFATMEKMCLPNKLQERVHQYYTHVWTEYRSLDGDIVKFQRELAHTLGLEVGLYNYMNLVMRIPFWESCSPDFATQIILNLAIRVYLPDDYIVRKGDTGDEMFMINRGICELSDPAKSQDPRNVAILESTASGSSEKFSAADDGMDNERESSEDKAKAGDTDVDRASSLLSHSKIGHKSIFRRSSTSTDKRAQVYPQKNKYEISPGEEASTKKSLKQILLYPGQAFGEMSLLMNYKRTANIRAATYVEICVFSRESFQRIISRYPEDRRHVLTMMLKRCIEKKEIPFPWDEVVDAVAERRRKHGTFGSSRLNVQATVTATEAAQALVDRIDVNRPDESIKYGFQTFHPDLTSASPRASVDDPVSSVSSNPRLRRNSLSKTVNSYSADEHFQHKAEITATQPPAESRIDGLEKALATMMNVVNSMAASMERLERLAQSRETVCCCGSSLRGSAKQSDCGGEARGADYTDVSPRTKIRRRKGSSNLFTDIQKSVDSSSGMASISNMPDKAKRNNVEVSRLGSLCQMEFSEAPLGIGSLEPALMVSSTAVVRQMSGIEVMNDACDPLSYDMPAQAQGWLPKTTSPEKDLTIAEQLWRRQKPVKRKIKKMSDYGKSATVARLKSQSALLRTRSSVPSNFKSSATAGHHEGQDISTLLGFGVEHHKTKRRGSRIGIDAFTVQATHDTDTSKSFTSRSCDDHCTQ